jgi:hypothetical protein
MRRIGLMKSYLGVDNDKLIYWRYDYEMSYRDTQITNISANSNLVTMMMMMYKVQFLSRLGKPHHRC